MQVLRNGARATVLAVMFVAILPTASLADCIQAQPIYARNNTGRPIWVAAHYIPAGSHSFVTDGWWEVAPGQCLLLLYNNGANIYFNAHDDQGNLWQGNATTVVVRGETVNMFHMDTGPCYNPWTVTFTR